MRTRTALSACVLSAALGLCAQAPAIDGGPAAPAANPWTPARCVRAALASHPDAQDARLVLAQARLRAADARAGMFPSVNLDAAYLSSSTRGGEPSFVSANGSRECLFQASLTQVLLDPTLLPLARAGAAQVDSAALDEASIRSEVAFETLRSLAEVLLARREEAVLSAAWKEAEVQAAQLDLLLKEGQKAKVDATQGRLLAFKFQKEAQKARGALRANEDGLSLLIGVTPLPPLSESLRDITSDRELPTGDPAVEVALQRRPEVASARSAQKAAQERYTAARRAYWPKVKGEAIWGWDTLQAPNRADRGWQGAVFLSLPLFTAGTLGRETTFQRLEVQKADDQVERVRRRIRSEVSEASTAFASAAEESEVAAKALEAANDVAVMSRTAFAEGSLSSLDLTAIETALVQAQLEQAQAALRLELTYWTCVRALGFPLPGTEAAPAPLPPEP